jgi:hypothetical protein
MSVVVTWNCGRWAGSVQSLSECKKAPCDKVQLQKPSCCGVSLAEKQGSKSYKFRRACMHKPA